MKYRGSPNAWVKVVEHKPKRADPTCWATVVNQSRVCEPRRDDFIHSMMGWFTWGRLK